MTKSKKIHRQTRMDATAVSEQMATPLEMAFAMGNYYLVRKLAPVVIGDPNAKEEQKKMARSLLERVGNDPRVFLVGIFGVLFALIVAFYSIK